MITDFFYESTLLNMSFSNSIGTSRYKENGEVKFKNACLTYNPDSEPKLKVKSEQDPENNFGSTTHCYHEAARTPYWKKESSLACCQLT
jgi:hypothetical protein